MSYDGQELTGGWDLAGDQIREEVGGGTNKQTKKSCIYQLLFNRTLLPVMTKGDLFVMLISFLHEFF